MSGNIVWSIFDYVVVDRNNNVYASGETRDLAKAMAQASGVTFPLVMSAEVYVAKFMPKRGVDGEGK